MFNDARFGYGSVERIQRTILDIKKPPFHVYITLPAHPEGPLNDPNVTTQVYWTMQTISFGRRSLLNEIRRALKARELRAKGEKDYRRVMADVTDTSYETIPAQACFDYVTLLNLRNWKKSGDRYLTEQIYVHTKLMIVDDLYAIFGSANINDRSLTGEGDSEIAVLVMDGDSTKADIRGNGRPVLVRKFARNLRMDIWKKLFGISGNIRPAAHLLKAIDAPAAPASWRMIQQQADSNADAFGLAFPWIPRNWAPRPSATGQQLPASIIPTWDPAKVVGGKVGKGGYVPDSMPFDAGFWSMPRHVTHGVAGLDNIKGFIVSLPIHWTEGENGHVKFPASLLTEKESDKRDPLRRQDGYEVAADNDAAPRSVDA